MQGKLIGRLSEISLPQPVDDCLQVLGRLLCGGPGHGPVMGSYWQPSDLLGRSGADSDKVACWRSCCGRPTMFVPDCC